MEENGTENPVKTGEYRPDGRFQKGDPRINRNGRPLGSISVVEEIKRQLQEIAEEDPQRRKKLELLVRKVILKAINEGDTSMIRDIIDRIDGKPTQTINVSNMDDVRDEYFQKLNELGKGNREDNIQG